MLNMAWNGRFSTDGGSNNARGRENLMKVKAQGFGGCLFVIATFVLTFGAWITHIVYCLEHKRWGFLIAGALVFPIAIIHGWLIWLGLA